MKLLKGLLAMWNFGLVDGLRMIRHTLWCDRQEMKINTTGGTPSSRAPGLLLSTKPFPNGANFKFTQSELNLRFLAHDLVQIEWNSEIQPIDFGLVKRTWPNVDTKLLNDGDKWSVLSDSLEVRVSSTGELSFFDLSGRLIREEAHPQWHDNKWIQRMQIQPEEHFYGMGERASGLNLKGAFTRCGIRMQVAATDRDPILYTCVSLST